MTRRVVSLDPKVVAALHSVRSLGSFFAVEFGTDVEFGAAGAGWHSLDVPPGDPLRHRDIGWLRHRDIGWLRHRVSSAQDAIAGTAACAPGDVPLRAAASIDLLGLSARIVSPVLAASVLAGLTPMLYPDRLWLRPGGHPVAITESTGTAVTSPPEAARAMYSGVVESVLAPLVSLYRSEFGVSTRVLWGDVASALNGAAQVVAGSGRYQPLRADDVVAALLATGELVGTARSLPPRFVRNSCCLYYRIPGGGLCGDCVLAG